MVDGDSKNTHTHTHPSPYKQNAHNEPCLQAPNVWHKLGKQSRHLILYRLWLRLSFPNDGKILKPKVGLGPNQT